MPLTVDTSTGLLPVGIHQATLAEVHNTFVAAAPYAADREKVFEALAVYVRRVSDEFQAPRVLLNGGFVTWKPWAAPRDADLAIGLDNADFKRAMSEAHANLRTLQQVSWVDGQTLRTAPRLQPMGGLVDGFFFPRRLDSQVRYWESLWSKVTDHQRKEIAGARKGFVEVTLS